MSLVDKLSSPELISTSSRCSVSILLESLDQDEAEQVAAIIIDETRSAPALSKVLAENGFKVGVDSIRRHRRKECQCS